jgi:gliding motility-associated-like protein
MKINSAFLYPILISKILGIALIASSSKVQGQIISTFDTDRDGWTALDNQSGPTPTYKPTGGNSGGYIEMIDGVAGTATYFVAPAKFLGNRSTSYGATLKFDLQVSITPNSSTAGVQLIGGGTTLVRLLPTLPAVAPNWTSYSFKLDETENWRISSTTGPIATQAQIMTVLDSLTALRINGEYNTSAADGGGLDNVILEITPVGDLVIYNGISANGDVKNSFFKILNIELSTQTLNNTVTIFNRWGNEVYKQKNYDNKTNLFNGLNKNGDELPSGTYFYKIEFDNGQDSKTGYLLLKR